MEGARSKNGRKGIKEGRCSTAEEQLEVEDLKGRRESRKSSCVYYLDLNLCSLFVLIELEAITSQHGMSKPFTHQQVPSFTSSPRAL
jgi:hypothetical protein